MRFRKVPPRKGCETVVKAEGYEWISRTFPQVCSGFLICNWLHVTALWRRWSTSWIKLSRKVRGLDTTSAVDNCLYHLSTTLEKFKVCRTSDFHGLGGWHHPFSSSLTTFVIPISSGNYMPNLTQHVANKVDDVHEDLTPILAKTRLSATMMS